METSPDGREVSNPDLRRSSSATPWNFRTVKEFANGAKFKWVVLALVVCAVGLIALLSVWKNAVGRSCHSKRRKLCADYCRLRVADGETIFVSVPSYRDPLASRTVVDAFEKARCPRRVFVGVCSQIDAEKDASFLDSYVTLAKRRARDGPMVDHVRVLEISHREARGPTLARSLIERQLYRGERYYLMVDSHTAFAPDWDVHCVQMLRSCPSGENSVLSTYPPDYSNAPGDSLCASDRNDASEEPKLPEKPAATYLRFKCFNAASGMPEIEGPSYVGKPAKPHPSAFWGACFSFGYGKTQIGKVPYDPHAHFVFLGEETSYAARLFTNGIDVFSPPATVAFHRWDRGYRSTFWELLDASKDPEANRRKALENIGLERVKLVLGMISLAQCRLPAESSVELDRYGLGKERTLDQYEKFAGVDLSRRKANARARMGLSPDPSTEDVLSKYGTMARYQAEQRKLESTQS